MDFDVLIKNGLLYDGTGSSGFRADLGVSGGRIAAIGNLEGAAGASVIDASGKIVCPGFIDTHSHSGILALCKPDTPHNVMQGITTCVVGQDAMGAAPIAGEFVGPWKKAMAGLEGSYDLDWSWRSLSDYLDRLDAVDLGPNFAMLAPHGNIRMCVMGLENRKPTAEELEKMKALLQECLDQGAFGMSTGMIYPPCSFADTEEFIELGRVLEKNDAVFVTHQRSEADAILPSMDEIIEIGKKSGCRIHFSHFKVAGRKNWAKFDEVLGKLDECSRQKIRVSVDQYPYVAGSTTLSVILPPWVHDGGTDRMLERLADPKARKRMTEDIEKGIPGWDNFVDFAGVDGIFVTFVKTEKNQWAVGKSLVEIGEKMGKSPLEATYDLLLEEEGSAGLVDFYGLEEHVVRILQRPEQNVCTDGIMGGKPHPRVYGTYPRVLGKYVREGALDMAAAIRKMTGKPAEVLGIKDRGLLQVGLAADIVVFDPETVRDTADYSDPIRYPEGIEQVLVNGEILVKDGIHRPGRAGRVLRYAGRR
jgi:N-acyl-D-amino-acid deacylase